MSGMLTFQATVEIFYFLRFLHSIGKEHSGLYLVMDSVTNKPVTEFTPEQWEEFNTVAVW